MHRKARALKSYCMSLQKQAAVLRKLSAAETEEPLLVVEELFDFADLPDLRGMLWNWLKVTVTGGYHKELSRAEKAAVIELYEKLEELIEAAYMMNTGRQIN